MFNLQENDILPMQTFEISTNKTNNNTLIISARTTCFFSNKYSSNKTIGKLKSFSIFVFIKPLKYFKLLND